MAIDGWNEVSLSDLFYAYRKAKADCFFEHSICISRRFVDYEETLVSNLMALHQRLINGEIDHILEENIGVVRITQKKLSIDPNDKKAKQHSYFSNPTRAFQFLKSSNTLCPEFRLFGDFPITMHILSALWINLVGHKYDEAITSSAFGSRLRRYRPEPGAPEGSVGNYHLEAVASFQPYFLPYKTWREKGLSAIRGELEDERSVIAISMDLTSYYHNLDPIFIADSQFLEHANIKLTDWQKDFSESISSALSIWSQIAKEKLISLGYQDSPSLIGGLPIGLSISRVVSNAFLIMLDRDITQGLAPVFYGRYVDDIFLVLRDPGHISGPAELNKYIEKRTEFIKLSENDKIEINYGKEYVGKTKLFMQSQKQKVFFLQGPGGIDLLDNIDSQIRSVSSERRLMHTPDQLDSMVSAKVLTAAGHPSDEADTLRRADGLSIRRLSWSVQLRAVETIARDLKASDWKAEREKFYKFSLSHILRPDKILDHLDYLPRLLSLAIALGDWANAKRMYEAARKSIKDLKQTPNSKPKINGLAGGFSEEGIASIWTDLLEGVQEISADAVARAIEWNNKGQIKPLTEVAVKFCKDLTVGELPTFQGKDMHAYTNL